MNKAAYGIIVIIALYLLFEYFNKKDDCGNVEDFYPYLQYPIRRNCFRNMFGQTVCYPPVRRRYPNYYYPYLRGDSSYVRRTAPFAVSPPYDRMHYWRSETMPSIVGSGLY